MTFCSLGGVRVVQKVLVSTVCFLGTTALLVYTLVSISLKDSAFRRLPEYLPIFANLDIVILRVGYLEKL